MSNFRDPSLWMVKCRLGEEKLTVLQLMRKCIAYSNNNEPLQIKSVIAPEGIKGYVYIEAYKQTHVKQVSKTRETKYCLEKLILPKLTENEYKRLNTFLHFQTIEGLGSLRIGLYKQQMVPIAEMTDVLRVTKETTGLKPKQWVRLKRGIYKDDLAQIDYVDLAQNQVHLKLLPRIDYTRKRGGLRDNKEDPKRKKKRKPPAKPFNQDEIRAIGGEITSDGDFLIFESNRYSHKGFLYKTFQLNGILTEGVTPTLAELERFGEVIEGIEASSGGGITKPSEEHNFATGDNVEVCEGELAHLQGKIIAIDGNMITVLPRHEDLKDPLDFQPLELRKYFTQGDHVRVIQGKYENDTGLIVRVEEHTVYLFSDLTMHELKVLPKDLQLCSDMASGVDSMGHFQWGDLIQLDPHTVGVIVRLEKELFHVLNMNGKVIQTKPQSIQKKREAKNVMGVDSRGNTIQKRDIVNVVDGSSPDNQGEVRHIYRNFVFLYSRMCLENGGIFVVKSNHLEVAGGVKSVNVNVNQGFMSPRLSSPAHSSQAPSNILSGGRSPGVLTQKPNIRGRNRDLIGQTIKITQGHYKGSIGIVKDATETTARVELHSSCQTISVDCNRIQVIGGASGKTGNITTYSKTPRPESTWSKTPLHDGNVTPGYTGGQTPGYGNRTPGYTGGQTPGYTGNQTPRADNWGDRTPSHNLPSSTPNRTEDEPWETTYNPQTPGTYVQNPFTPATPGGYASDHGFSPYQQPSPQVTTAFNPSPVGFEQGPSPYYPVQSPGYFQSPMTPSSAAFVGGGAPPGTPGTGNYFFSNYF
jgi:transcription elongation factor SPT5